MKDVWIHKANSFKDADKFDRNYYSAMSGEERLETMQFLREIHHKIKGDSKFENKNRKEIRRVITIIDRNKVGLSKRKQDDADLVLLSNNK